jgi:hypothetical protein
MRTLTYTPCETHRFGAPPALLAIARAAHLIGDRDLERSAREELSEVYGIDVRFRKQREGNGDAR